MNEEKILDIIPIFKNEMFPTKDTIWHIKTNKKDIENHLELVLDQIKMSFSDYDYLIILKEGMVIDII